ncbi:MAG: hypothetical protein ACYS5V_15505, partial [Planctomycetota bacterium]
GLGGYSDWPKAPLFQDMGLYSQMWVVEHANGVRFQPVAPDGLPHTDRMRARLMIFAIPAAEAPEWVDQTARAVAKVAGRMSALARRQRGPSR